jgi:hypothetical protein
MAFRDFSIEHVEVTLFAVRHIPAEQRCNPRPNHRILELLYFVQRSRPLSSTLGTRLGCFLAIASLTFAPLSPAQDTPLGVVLQANLAHVRQSALSEGASIFSGEEISTDVSGSADIRIANSRYGLAANSQARFYSAHAAKGFVAELSSGTLTFRRDNADSIEVFASDVRITPQGDAPATGQVTIFSPCKISVTAITGDLQVTAGAETHLVAEKESYEVLPQQSVIAVANFISPDDPAYHQSHTHKTCTTPRQSKGTSQFAKIGIIAGAGAAAAVIFLAHGGSKSGSANNGGGSSGGGVESPDKP